MYKRKLDTAVKKNEIMKSIGKWIKLARVRSFRKTNTVLFICRYNLYLLHLCIYRDMWV